MRYSIYLAVGRAQVSRNSPNAAIFLEMPREGRRWQGPLPAPRPSDAATAKHLAKRTLTNLYNERPTWLDLAHRRLDAAVFAAYGWDPALTDDQLLEKLLALNLERAAEK